MRVGVNPKKNSKNQKLDYYHQVIIPIYIPEEEGYFKDSFTILTYCIDSLLTTAHEKTYITLVNNGSCKKVQVYLDELLETGSVQEVIHSHNIGKINAIFKGVVGHNFPLITIADADVLFLNSWQQASYDIFNAFPRTGFVSTTPNPKLYKYHTFPVVFKYLFSKKLRFERPGNSEALTAFAKSIGNPSFFTNSHLENVLTITDNNCKAVLGAGHFVATYRATILKQVANQYSNYKLGAKAVRVFLDQPAANMGYWRLATYDNYTYHLGNKIESWMVKKLKNTTKSKEILEPTPLLATSLSSSTVTKMKRLLIEKLIFSSFFLPFLLKYKGLKKIEVKNYLARIND